MDADNIINGTHGIYGHELLKLSLSVLAGCILGLEREIRGKSAGFRTLALICFGATIFTVCSYLLGVEANRDRIAANIITGIGFIGAGVIFRTDSSISGITTAASIWVAAAIGMLLGIGEYSLAGISLVFALIILYALDFIQFWIDDKFAHRNYKITFRKDCPAKPLNDQVRSLKLKQTKTKILRADTQTIIEFEISGKESNLDLFNEWLIENQSILSIEC
ncbi:MULTISPECIES: MgtC/SapB family protein [unclassified Mucilaginibacter]|uniref:MgtC/SapB family protein n=1 Tax=unclassified Mucilaginibacter TaxID=2617802 RepID=UPI002AC8B613|nr:MULTISPECIES: MgtC/SapB family protein [unclassified Mucilaginibacter]MEB0260699.1 MgtC/SapB family protein [Mucilaginibacter sp. 10I4]MEB0280628.1 MgtC/SapB family protein [Mucilaginibacter sp. 10B2]MEB0300301.1 MgtC/SapB family protein [Mucilaginibacter sp. 5C4]WPX24955.1 MgtC/SapB family protein [Mucilaginibacter sp. 5C4]